MSNQVTLGGDRLGSGNKQKVELHGFERSTHDLGYTWRSTMAAGTLVPFMSEVALPGDTFDIDLNCDIRTHPTIGPLFGSFKVQLDVFAVPMRLYIAALHNNTLGIGNRMQDIKLPKVQLIAKRPNGAENLDTYQINPSSIFSYLGISGAGLPGQDGDTQLQVRKFNAIPYLALWDIYKNYYSNKQEEKGYVIHNAVVPPTNYISQIDGGNNFQNTFQKWPSISAGFPFIGTQVRVTPITPGDNIWEDEILFITANRGAFTLAECTDRMINVSGVWEGSIKPEYLNSRIIAWDYIQNWPQAKQPIRVTSFDLNNIDRMREAILQTAFSSEMIINNYNLEPYSLAVETNNLTPDARCAMEFTQEGLPLKTYQSDLFNNWLSTEWIDGSGGINEITAVDTSGGSFNIDALNLSKKVYDMLNRIAVSGGTYDDWLSAVYDHESYTRAENPVYMGGLIKELVFQEVVSNAATQGEPLGQLAGKGVMGDRHKGGKVYVRTDEPSYIMALVSLTPRLDYSQGNKWDVHLNSLNDLHKPSLDGIGFQELITEQMAWWTTTKVVQTAGNWEQESAGKQPAWINYMTNVNQVKGNFAIPENEGFMVLTRRYESEAVSPYNLKIKDLTTYVDPSKFNHIFADTSLDAQNFWVQIKVDITARRKMSAKVMPNL